MHVHGAGAAHCRPHVRVRTANGVAVSVAVDAWTAMACVTALGMWWRSRVAPGHWRWPSGGLGSERRADQFGRTLGLPSAGRNLVRRWMLSWCARHEPVDPDLIRLG